MRGIIAQHVQDCAINCRGVTWNGGLSFPWGNSGCRASIYIVLTRSPAQPPGRGPAASRRNRRRRCRRCLIAGISTFNPTASGRARSQGSWRTRGPSATWFARCAGQTKATASSPGRLLPGPKKPPISQVPNSIVPFGTGYAFAVFTTGDARSTSTIYYP